MFWIFSQEERLAKLTLAGGCQKQLFTSQGRFSKKSETIGWSSIYSNFNHNATRYSKNQLNPMLDALFKISSSIKISTKKKYRSTANSRKPYNLMLKTDLVFLLKGKHHFGSENPPKKCSHCPCKQKQADKTWPNKQHSTTKKSKDKKYKKPKWRH